MLYFCGWKWIKLNNAKSFECGVFLMLYISTDLLEALMILSVWYISLICDLWVAVTSHSIILLQYLFLDYETILGNEICKNATSYKGSSFTWEENNKRKWKPLIDSCIKWAHDFCLNYSPLTFAIGLVSPNMQDFASQEL